MSKPIIAVLGSKGMLGTDIVNVLREHDRNVIGYHRPNFDITSTSDLEKVVRSAEIIINCAAFTNVDGAETDREQARAVNTLAVNNLGRLAAEFDRYVVHTSTDFVYDGRQPGCYTELDIPNPINYYGRSKLDGERFLQKSGCRHAIVRVQWTYGNTGNNFISKICQRASQSDRILVVNDQIGSPSSTLDVAAALYELTMNRSEGLFQFAANGYATRFEIAEFIVQKLGFSVDVSPCETSDFVMPAQRPLNSKFDCKKIDTILSQGRAEWKISLNKFLEQIK